MTEMPEMLKLVVLGGLAGVLSGMFGIGGGLVIVPAVSVLIFGFDIKAAIGTSLFVILLQLDCWDFSNTTRTVS